MPISQGPHAKDFRSKIGKTSFVGLPVKVGDAWKAKGTYIPIILVHLVSIYATTL